MALRRLEACPRRPPPRANMPRSDKTLEKLKAVLDALDGRHLTADQVGVAVNISYEVARQRLLFLHRLGNIEREGGWRGVWVRTDTGKDENMPKMGGEKKERGEGGGGGATHARR